MNERQAVKTIVQYNSKLQNDVLLVEVLLTESHFVVKVLGEDELAFGNLNDAIAYAKEKNKTFYAA